MTYIHRLPEGILMNEPPKEKYFGDTVPPIAFWLMLVVTGVVMIIGERHEWPPVPGLLLLLVTAGIFVTWSMSQAAAKRHK